MSSINTPTYFVGHPDGSYSMADPQPIPEFEWRYKDGGPVHPCRIPTGGLHACDEPEPTKLHFGKSLRDDFAGLAMQGMLGGTWPDKSDLEETARRAYMLADEMLKAREQKGGAE